MIARFSLFTQVLLCLTLFMGLNPAKAQYVVEGVVKDAGNGQPLPGVNIAVGSGGTITDLDGKFMLRFESREEVLLRFSYIGYQKIQKVVQPGDSILFLKISLKATENALDEIIVTASRFAQSRSSVTQSTEIVKTDQVLSFNSVNPDDALNRIPGLNVARGQLNIRGSSGFTYNVGSRVMVLLDGLPLISGESGEVRWNVLPMEIVEQIEVIKGSGSALYGSSALGGVVHFRTRKPGLEPRSYFTVFHTLYDAPPAEHRDPWVGIPRPTATGIQFSHLRKIKKLELGFGLNMMDDDGYRVADPSRRLRLNMQTRLEVLKGLYIGANITHLIDSTRLYTFWESNFDAYTPFPGSVNPQLNHRTAFDPFVEYIPNGDSKHSLRNRYYRSRTNYNNEDYGLGETWFTEYQYQQRFHLGFAKSSVLTTGFVNQHNLIGSDRLYGTQNTDNRSAYLQLDQQIWRFTYALGARYERFVVNGVSQKDKTVFRAGLNFEVTKTTFLRASYGEGFRYPSVAELFSNTFIGSVRLSSDPGLRPEQSKSLEVGLLQSFQLGNFEILLDLAYFRTDYTDMIEYSFGVVLPTTYTPQDSADIAINNWAALASRYARFQPGNVVQAQITGIESSLRGKGKIGLFHTEWLLGYTYIDPVNLNPSPSVYGLPVDLMKYLKYRYKHLARTDLSLGFGVVSAGVNVRYNSTILNIDEDFYRFMPGLIDYRLAHIKGDLITDLRLVGQLGPLFRVSLIVRNAGNRSFMAVPGNIGEQRTFVIQLHAQL